jgi:hypothetical protein
MKIFTGNGKFVTVENASTEQLREILEELRALPIHNRYEEEMGHVISSKLGEKFFPANHPSSGWYSRTL